MTETTRKDIEHGSYRNADNVIAELDRRLAEDDANPDDIVSLETVRTEAQARYGSGIQMVPKLTVEQLKAALAQGLASGPGIPADEAFNRLEDKYRKLATAKLKR